MRNDLVGLGGTNDDLNLCALERVHFLWQPSYLDRTTINEHAVQLLESSARAISPLKGDVGNAAALRVGAIY